MNASTNSLPISLRMNSSGFTLIELMVTIAVLAILVSIAAPSISTQLANQRVKSTTSTIANALKEAKVESVIRRQPLVFSFDNTSKVINIQYVSGSVKNTIASYKYNNKSILKSDITTTKFKPGKTADAITYTICDSNYSASPSTIEVSTTAVISTKSGGTCI